VPAAAVARLRKSLRSAARWWEDQSSVATVNPGTSTGDDRRVCSNRVLHGHLLGLAADLVAVTVARLAVDHRAASRSGTNDAGVGVDDVVEARGTGYKRTCYTAPGLLSCRRRANLDHHARRADPREHGRQAARSERDRPERASELYAESAASAPPRAALLTRERKLLSSNGGRDTRLDLGRGFVSWPRIGQPLPARYPLDVSPREGPRSSRVSRPPLETANSARGDLPGCPG